MNNKYPDGKMSEDDEGQLVIQVKDHEQRVLVGFNKLITWLGFDTEQATEFANCILKVVQEIKDKRHAH